MPGQGTSGSGPRLMPSALSTPNRSSSAIGPRTERTWPDNSSDRLTGSARHCPDATRPHGAILTVHPGSRRMRSLPRSDGLPADSQLRPNDSQSRAR